MKKLFTLLFVVALLSIWVEPAGAITWGELDSTHTNVGAIVINHPEYGPLGWCSGTLVAPQAVLTAGHCMNSMKYFPIEWMFVTFEDNVWDSEYYHPVDHYVIHPEYVDQPDVLIPAQRSDNHDLAVVILQEPVPDIDPATLPEVGFLNRLWDSGQLRQGSNGGMFTIVGYGATVDFPPPVQNIDGFRRATQSEFLSLLPARLHTSTNPALGNGGGCFMDSGGPAFWTTPDGNEVLVGVLSWAKKCVASQVHYRLDSADSLSFINEVIESIR